MDIIIPTSVTQSLGLAESQPQPELKAPEPKAKAEPKPKAEEPPKDLTAAEKKIWKLKVDGEEIDYDATDEAVVKNDVAKARWAQKRVQESAIERKKYDAERERLKANPWEVLKELGLDPDEIAEARVWAKMEESRLTPEQKRQKELEAENKRYRDAEDKQKSDADAQKHEALTAHYEAQFESQIMEALDSGGLPKNRMAVRRMGYYLDKAAQLNIDVSPKDLVDQVRKDLLEEHDELYRDRPDLIKEETRKKLREEDAKRLKSTQPEAHKKVPSKDRPRQESKRKLSGDEWREDLQRRMFGGK